MKTKGDSEINMTEFKVVIHLPGKVVESIVRSESQHILQTRYKEAFNSNKEMLMIEDKEGTKFIPVSKILYFEIIEPMEEIAPLVRRLK